MSVSWSISVSMATSVNHGNSVTCTITVKNTGNETASNCLVSCQELNYYSSSFSLAKNTSKTITYTFTPGWYGSKSLKFIVSNSGGLMATNSVTKTLTVNDARNDYLSVEFINNGGKSAVGIEESYNLILKSDSTDDLLITSLSFDIPTASQAMWSLQNSQYSFSNSPNTIISFANPYNLNLIMKLLHEGTAHATITVNYTIHGFNKTQTLTIDSKIEELPSIDDINYDYSCNVSSVYKGDSCYINVNFYNNYAHCIVPQLVIELPNGIMDENNLGYIVINSFELGYKKSNSFSKQINAVSEGNYVIGESQLSVYVRPVNKAVFNSDWAVLSNVDLYPYDIAKLIIKYEVVNQNNVNDNNYPITVPKTTIQLPNCLKFNNQTSKSVVIPEKTLSKNQSFQDEFNVLLDNDTRDKVNVVRNNVVNVSNDLLSTKLINVTSNPMKPNLNYFFKPLSSIIEFKKDLIVPLEINFTNDSETAAKITNYKITLNSENDIATFEDGSTTLEYKNATGITVVEVYSLNIPIYIHNHSENVTITFKCDEAGTSTTQNVYIPTPVSPTFEFETQVEGTNIIFYNEDNHETSKVTVKLTNTNYISSNTSFKIVLNDGLKFIDDSSELTVDNVYVGSGETVFKEIPKLIKGTKIGANSFDIYDQDDFLVGFGTINVTVPTLSSKGSLKIVNSKFRNNKSANGGAVYNLSNFEYSDCIFTDNEVTSKCPNIYDNGVCRS